MKKFLKKITFLLILETIPFTLAWAEPIEIERITPQFMPQEAFSRISEYITGEENSGRRVILRTQPEARAGLYFVIQLDQSAALLPADSQLTIRLITSKAPQVRTYTLAFLKKVGPYREVFAGLTGKDWPSQDARDVVAWNVRIEAASGEVLAEHQSFAWQWAPFER